MKRRIACIALIIFLLGVVAAEAKVLIQCPCTPDTSIDHTGDINPDTGNIECRYPSPVAGPRNIACKHLTGGDGFISMADRTLLEPLGASTMYIFGFADVTGLPDTEILSSSILTANFAAPTISIKEGQEFYLTLTNVGLFARGDLFDHHTVHFHGFINAGSFFDGEPMASFGPMARASITYYYNLLDPGTYIYHCHVEAPEHMQMGMLGNLYVRPLQDDTTIPALTSLGYTGFAYNDGDGSTGYHKAYPIQIHAVDPVFHYADLHIQPPNFVLLDEVYPMLNGRGYPDTTVPGDLPAPYVDFIGDFNKVSQKISSLITATAGQKILLRISNLSFHFYTLSVLGIPMKVVGRDAKLLRGPAPTFKNLSYNTNSITLGGGQSTDVILDTAGKAPGTYFLYTTNLNNLSNNQQERGGMMTEIVINAPPP
jgi:FtsP/CotA-like multicopper oxidase with cupredoxin domain